MIGPAAEADGVAELGTAPARTDRMLLEAFRDGDQAAFAELLVRHGALVQGVCRHILRQDADAEDAAQAVFIILARRAPRLHAVERLDLWLHRVATRLCWSLRRRRRRRWARERALANVAAPATASAAREAAADRLHEALDALPHASRQVLILHYLLGRSQAEIGALLGIPEGTVAWRMSRARDLLAQRLRQPPSLILIPLLAAPGHLPRSLQPLATHGPTLPLSPAIQVMVGVGTGTGVVLGAGGAAWLGATSLMLAAAVGAAVVLSHASHARPFVSAPATAATKAAVPPSPAVAHRVLHVGGADGVAHFADLPPLRPGDVVAVAAGIYQEAVRCTVDGTAEAPITITGPVSGEAVLQGAGLVLDGVFPRTRALLEISGSHYRIRRLHLTGARNGHNAAGLRLLRARDIEMDGCRVDGCDIGFAATYGDGIDARGCLLVGNGVPGDGTGPNIVVNGSRALRLQACRVTDAVGENIWSNARTLVLEQCLIAASGGGEIDVLPPAADAEPEPAGGPEVSVIRRCVLWGSAHRPTNAKRFLVHDGPQRHLLLLQDVLEAGSTSQVLVQAPTGAVLALNCCFTGSPLIASGAARWLGGGNALASGASLPLGCGPAILAPPVPAAPPDRLAQALGWTEGPPPRGGVDVTGWAWADGVPCPLLAAAQPAAEARSPANPPWP